MDALRNTKPTTTPKTAPTTPPPAAPAADEGAEDIAALSTSKAATTAPEKHLPLHELNAVRGEVRRQLEKSDSLPHDDADALAGKLARLPSADFKQTMNEIATKPGQLEKLVDSMSPAVRAAFIESMVTKGYIATEPSPPVPSSSPPYAPKAPPSPVMLRDDPKLPAAVRALVVKEDSTRAMEYNESFDGYRKSYQTAVEGTKSVAELRALGPMVEPQSPEHLPGLKNLQDPNNIKYQESRGSNLPDVETTALLADQMRRLTGRPVAGDVSFSLEGKVLLKIGPPDAHYIRGVEGKAKLVDGQVHGHGEQVAGVGVGGAFVESDLHGKNVTAGYEDHHAHVGGSIKAGEEGVEVKGKANGVVVKGGLSSENEMSLGAGLSGEVGFGEFGAVEGEVIASVGFQGVTQEDSESFVSASEVGFFDIPPELTRGKSWASLPEETRGDYERNGWSEKEWSTAVDLKKSARRT